MRVATAAFVAALAWAPAPAAGPAEEVRVFQVRYRSLQEATAVVEPLLSAAGSILIHPQRNTLTVRDEGAVLERVARALQEWDLPPAAYRVEVTALLASATAPPPGPFFAPEQGVGEAILKLWKYQWLEELGSVTVTASEGSPAEAAVGERFMVRFTLREGRTDPRRLVLSRLEFSRRQEQAAGQVAVEPLIRGTVSLKLGQKAVVGAARSETAEKAVFLVLSARRGNIR